MALERDAIVRPDIPVGRRGYDQSAVDAHLERIAADVDELRRAAEAPASRPGVGGAAGGRGGVVGGAAGEQVRVIVAAAEERAAGIEQTPREEAAAPRARADEESRAEVARVRDVVGGLLDRLGAAEG